MAQVLTVALVLIIEILTHQNIVERAKSETSLSESNDWLAIAKSYTYKNW